jgi:hypothetical protein
MVAGTGCGVVPHSAAQGQGSDMALFRNLVSTLAGRAVAERFGGAAAGPAGMVLGAALPFVMRRLGPMGMVGLAVGAWAVGRVMAAQAAPKPAPPIGLPLPDLVLAPDPVPHPGTALIPDSGQA